MSGDQALTLIMNALQITLWVAGPILLAALVAGVLIGVAQTVLQINEGSVAFVVKVAAVITVLLVLGSVLATKLVDYTRGSLESIEHVVH